MSHLTDLLEGIHRRWGGRCGAAAPGPGAGVGRAHCRFSRLSNLHPSGRGAGRSVRSGRRAGSAGRRRYPEPRTSMRPCFERSRRCCCWTGRRDGERLRSAVPAVDGSGDGQGGGGHGLLLLQPAAGSQRGRRRPREDSARRRTRFHAFCARVQSERPRTLLASATHDTKRGEDTRLRIGLLSEMPERWAEAVRRWSRMNAVFRRNGFPEANREYVLYQTLVGTWPIGIDRLGPYMLKAAREAKVHTSWTNPDPVFEEALQRFVEGVLGHAAFTADLSTFLNAHGQAGDDHLPGADAHQVHRPGDPGFLPGGRSLGLQPGGPGQPPAGGFRSPLAPAGPACVPVRRRNSGPGHRRHG